MCSQTTVVDCCIISEKPSYCLFDWAGKLKQQSNGQAVGSSYLNSAYGNSFNAAAAAAIQPSQYAAYGAASTGFSSGNSTSSTTGFNSSQQVCLSVCDNYLDKRKKLSIWPKSEYVWLACPIIFLFLFVLFQTADYTYPTSYNQSAYTNPYYYPYLSATGATSLGGTTASTVPSTQTYQLIPSATTTGCSKSALIQWKQSQYLWAKKEKMF